MSSTGLAYLPRTSQIKLLRGPGRIQSGSKLVPRASKSDPDPDANEEIPDLIPLAGAETDWRQFRAQLAAGENTRGKFGDVAGLPREGIDDRLSPELPVDEDSKAWAHPIGAPEAGCLLIAHPLMFTSQQTHFSQSVILIFTHNDSGTAGLLLNRPTGFTLGDVSGAEFLCPEFGKNLLYLGGDVGKSTLHLVHGFSEMKGCREVVSGVYMGGFDDAVSAVKEGSHKAEEFKWYGRYCGWAPGQVGNKLLDGEQSMHILTCMAISFLHLWNLLCSS